MSQSIKEVLAKHMLWTRDEGGDRANLTGAYLARANLARANLARANLARANLDGAYLAGANLAGANLAGANLAGANLARANLAGANLDRANLDGANLAGAYLAGANLARANLAGANLDGAYLDGATGIMQATCSWSDHGRSGRQLVAVYQYAHGDRPASLVYHCGCFRGTESELRAGIAADKWDEGDVTPERIGKLRKSRTVAVDFVSARMGEMLSDRGLAA